MKNQIKSILSEKILNNQSRKQEQCIKHNQLSTKQKNIQNENNTSNIFQQYLNGNLDIKKIEKQKYYEGQQKQEQKKQKTKIFQDNNCSFKDLQILKENFNTQNLQKNVQQTQTQPQLKSQPQPQIQPNQIKNQNIYNLIDEINCLIDITTQPLDSSIFNNNNNTILHKNKNDNKLIDDINSLIDITTQPLNTSIFNNNNNSILHQNKKKIKQNQSFRSDNSDLITNQQEKNIQNEYYSLSQVQSINFIQKPPKYPKQTKNNSKQFVSQKIQVLSMNIQKNDESFFSENQSFFDEKVQEKF